jgi:hypothetical protein
MITQQRMSIVDQTTVLLMDARISTMLRQCARIIITDIYTTTKRLLSNDEKHDKSYKKVGSRFLQDRNTQ